MILIQYFLLFHFYDWVGGRVTDKFTRKLTFTGKLADTDGNRQKLHIPWFFFRLFHCDLGKFKAVERERLNPESKQQ